ncbi:hypothetical protein WR25_01305 [Diploscapter pachys]|uniref:Carbon storage regulator n=2 Tax=cellular organisms TaxID=131567 RepID=A0A2A2KC53_9BILA|nr:hypothetical protein WR25_01305 [Diploscapter pachys]
MKAQVGRLLEGSPINAADIAEYIHARVAAGEFLILPHEAGRQAWKLKCQAPQRLYDDMADMAAKAGEAVSDFPLSERQRSMLVIGREVGEVIVIDGGIRIQVMSVENGQVRFGICAPRDVEVHRIEVYKRIKALELQKQRA